MAVERGQAIRIPLDYKILHVSSPVIRHRRRAHNPFGVDIKEPGLSDLGHRPHPSQNGEFPVCEVIASMHHQHFVMSNIILIAMRAYKRNQQFTNPRPQPTCNHGTILLLHYFTPMVHQCNVKEAHNRSAGINVMTSAIIISTD